MNRVTALIWFAGSYASWTQDFTLQTPKGEVFVQVSKNAFYLGSFFDIKGTVTNTTNWDFEHLRMRVAFYDARGREMTELCDRSDCETLGLNVPARQTVAWREEPGATVHAGPLNPPRASSYRLFFKDGQYRMRWNFVLIKPTPSDDFSYEDESVSVVIKPAPNGIELSLRNKTAEPVTINWNNVSWVDYSGEAHKLIHSRIKLADKEATQAPTLIPPQARINETLFPADHVRSTSSGWHREPLWPDLVDITEDHSRLKGLEGTAFSVFLPLEAQAKMRAYSFVFTTRSVEF